jgi:hypothetical protein
MWRQTTVMVVTLTERFVRWFQSGESFQRRLDLFAEAARCRRWRHRILRIQIIRRQRRWLLRVAVGHTPLHHLVGVSKRNALASIVFVAEAQFATTKWRERSGRRVAGGWGGLTDVGRIQLQVDLDQLHRVRIGQWWKADMGQVVGNVLESDEVLGGDLEALEFYMSYFTSFILCAL